MFKIVITNEVEDFELLFSVRETEIAKKWFSELQKDYSIYEDFRFTKWGNKDIIEKLNHYIDIINNYDQIIDKKVDQDVTQEDLNYLHKFFEDLRGEVEIGTEWFNNSPSLVQNAVEKFNILIHELETELRPNDHPTLVVTFNNRPRFKLSEEDIKHFTYKWEQGTVYINYCHVGKPLLDVIKDNDNIAEGIRPQTHYSADFMIKFGPSTPENIFQARQKIIQEWLTDKVFTFENYNLGMIPVADIITSVNVTDLFKYNRVKEIQCIL